MYLQRFFWRQRRLTRACDVRKINKNPFRELRIMCKHPIYRTFIQLASISSDVWRYLDAQVNADICCAYILKVPFLSDAPFEVSGKTVAEAIKEPAEIKAIEDRYSGNRNSSNIGIRQWKTSECVCGLETEREREREKQKENKLGSVSLQKCGTELHYQA